MNDNFDNLDVKSEIIDLKDAKTGNSPVANGGSSISAISSSKHDSARAKQRWKRLADALKHHSFVEEQNLTANGIGIGNGDAGNQGEEVLHASKSIGTEKSVNSGIKVEKSEVHYEESTIKIEESLIIDEELAIRNEESLISIEDSSIRNERSAIKDEETAIGFEASMVKNAKSVSIRNSGSTENGKSVVESIGKILRIENGDQDGTLADNGEIEIDPKSRLQVSPRFETLELIRWEQITDDPQWWRATLTAPSCGHFPNGSIDHISSIPTKSIDQSQLSLLITFVPPSIRVDELIGFDNTGNIRVWASEEIMAYWSVWSLIPSLRKSNRRGLIVCELAAGMTSLCGYFLATSLASSIGDSWAENAIDRLILTDGNEKCVDNSRLIFQRNRGKLMDRIDHLILKFGQRVDDLGGKVDVILAADCLFFEDTHRALLETIDFLLKSGGRAFLFAPERNGTLNQFVITCQYWPEFTYKLVDLAATSLFDHKNRSDAIKNGGIDFAKLVILEKV